MIKVGLTARAMAGAAIACGSDAGFHPLDGERNERIVSTHA